VRYVQLRGETHLSLPLRIDLLAGPLSQWLPQQRACPAFALPAGG
jgi:hypothetical protein